MQLICVFSSSSDTENPIRYLLVSTRLAFLVMLRASLRLQAYHRSQKAYLLHNQGCRELSI